MSSGDGGVFIVLWAVAKQILESEERRKGQVRVKELYGLKSMSSEEAEVRDILGVLSKKILESEDIMNGQEIGTALWSTGYE